MKKNRSRKEPDPEARIAALVRKLQATEQELQELTAGELDAVATRDGRYYLLSEAQAKLRTHADAMRQATEMQSGILNALPAHIALLDAHGVILGVNEAWRRFASANTLQSNDFFVGQNYLGVCEAAHGECADEAQAVAAGIRKVLGGELKTFALEYPCHSPTEQRWFRLMVTALSDAPGTGAVVMHVNVTERRQAEEVLRQKELEQRRLAEELTIETRRLHESQAVANVGTWETDLASWDVTWTQETFRIFETSPDQFNPTHQGFLERIHPEDRQKVDDAFQDSLGQPGSHAIEHRLLFPDGRIKFVEERWRAFKDEAGRPVRAVGTCQDITLRKQAEKAVTISEASLARAQRIAHMGNWDWNLVTGELYWSAQIFELFGIDPSHAPETYERFIKGVHPEDRERTHQAVMDAVEGRAPYNVEHRVLWPDGTVRVLHEQGEVTRDAEGRPLNMIGNVQDITERKAAEELLTMRARQQEAIAKLGFEATRTTTLEGIFDVATRTVAEALGVELCKVLQLVPDGSHFRLVSGVGWQAGLIGVGRVGVERESQAGFTLSSDGPIYVNDFARETRFQAPPLLQQHDVVSGLSVKILLRDKPWGVLGAHSRTVRKFTDADADFMQVVASLLAVVIERLAVQRTLTESEARMRDAQRIAHLGNWDLDLAKNKLTWSDEVFRIFGVDSMEFPATYEAFLELVHPDDREARRAAQRLALSGQAPLEIEHRIIRADGEVRYVRERGELIRNEPGEAVALSGTVLDITDRRKNEEQLRTTANRLALATQAGGVGIWDYEVAGNRLIWDDQMFRLYGLPREQFSGAYEAWKAGVHPDDRQRGDEEIQQALRGEKDFDTEFRVLWPDGSTHYIRALAMVERDAAGRPVRMVGTNWDFTERKQAEAALRESEERLEFILATNSIGSWGLDLETQEAHRSLIHDRIFGYDQLLPNWTFEIFLAHILPEDRAEVKRKFEAALAGRHDWDFECRIKRRDGETRWIWATGSHGRNPSGHTQKMSGLVMDITERKQTEAALRENEERFRLMIEGSEQVLFYTHDRDHRFNYLSPSTLEVLGYAPEALVGQPCDLLVIADDPLNADVHALTDRALQDGKPCAPYLTVVRHQDGRRIVLEILESPIHRDGQIIGIQGFARDITERENAQAALAESQRQYRDLVETSQNVIWSVDLEGRFTFVNQAVRHVFGRDPEEMIGHRYHDFVPEEQQQANDELLARMLRDGQDAINYTNRIRRKDGRIAILNSNARVVRDPQGNTIGFSGMSQDTTEIVQAQEAIARSEARFRGLFDQAAVGMCLASTEGRFLRTNQKFCEIVGYSAEELLKRDCVETTHPDDRAREAETVARMLAGELQTAAWEKRYLHKDGPAVWCNLTLSLLPGEGGQPQQFVGVIEDISERRAAVEQLRQREQLLRIAGTVARLGGWSVDFPEVHITWSDEVCAIHDLPVGTVPVLDRALDFYTSESRPLIESAFSRCATAGTPFDVEIELLSAKGQRKWVRSIGQAERDESGVIRRVLGAFQDITEQKKLEVQFLRAQRMESIGTLAGGIAHDLNNVLAPIMMSLDLLRTSLPAPDDQQLLDTMATSVRRGADLVKQVLGFARGIEGQRTAVNSLHLMRDLMAVMRDTFPKNIDVSLSTGRDLWAVNGDRTQIHQVFLNLCVNARDAMPHGGRLAIRMENLAVDTTYAGMNPGAGTGPHVMIAVEDSGTGISRELQERIFEPFFTTKEIGKGTGLGLSTTLAIVRSHGGFIQLYSELGKGTTFRVYLPAITGEVTPESLSNEENLLPQGHGELVLIVDDEEAIRRAAERALERFGYRVLTAANGAEAVSLYAQRGKEIAVVLTDMAMPVMDGPATIIALKALNPSVKIIASSGHDGEAKAKGAGVRHFVPKPYTAEKILAVLTDILQENR